MGAGGFSFVGKRTFPEAYTNFGRSQMLIFVVHLLFSPKNVDFCLKCMISGEYFMHTQIFCFFLKGIIGRLYIRGGDLFNL